MNGIWALKPYYLGPWTLRDKYLQQPTCSSDAPTRIRNHRILVQGDCFFQGSSLECPSTLSSCSFQNLDKDYRCPKSHVTPIPMINKPPPLNRDYDKGPNIEALKRRGFINHGSTLPKVWVRRPPDQSPSPVQRLHSAPVFAGLEHIPSSKVELAVHFGYLLF